MSKMKLLFPKDFKEDEHIFLMSGTYRGDMYHFRAAMQIVKYSVVLYDSSTGTKQLEEYLKRSALKNAKHIWVVSWTWETFSNT